MAEQVVKLGLYGCGSRTRGILNSLYGENEYEVVSAYDIREEATESAVERFGGKVCSSSEELISHDGIDAFIISLDPFAHPEALDSTLEAGKPIYLEKPIAPTAERAYRMMQAANEKKVPVHVGLIHRYTQSIRSLRKFMAENDPGRIFNVYYDWLSNCECEILNCGLQSGPKNFRLLISQLPYHCCHALDTLTLLGGAVKSVYARSIKWMEWDYVTPDEIMALIEYESGAMGHFHFSGVCMRGYKYPGKVHAENYTIEFSPWTGFEVYHRPQRQAAKWSGEPGDVRPHYRDHSPEEVHNYLKFDMTAVAFRDFLNSVRTGGPMVVPIEEGYKVAEFAGAIERSYETRREVALPLKFD